MAISLAKKINCDIICADSRIVYKNLDIVSAKPTKEEQEGVVHHLIDILEPTKEFSAGGFTFLAKKIIEEEFKKNKPVIITGGTWFYIKSLLDFECLPECSINKKLREELEKLTNEELYQKLIELDNLRAQKIHINNRDKIIRSIEMCLSLGQPISSYKRKENEKYDASWFMVDINRDELYEKINLRVDIMLKMGLFEEWQKNKELYPSSKILENTIGYKEFFELEKGTYPDFNFAIDKIKQHTRNFAKRQLTYFNNNPIIKKINNEDEILESLV